MALARVLEVALGLTGALFIWRITCSGFPARRLTVFYLSASMALVASSLQEVATVVNLVYTHGVAIRAVQIPPRHLHEHPHND